MKTIKNIQFNFLIFAIFIYASLRGDLNQMNPSPIHVLRNANSEPSLVNSVDFHPNAQLFCVTYTHNNQIAIYKMIENDRARIIQVFQSKRTKLSCPQHALFSRDGQSLLVANWCNQTFNVYQADLQGMYQQVPSSILPFFTPSANFRPHGMAFSPDGNYLAVAFGASKLQPRAIALYQVNNLGTEQANFRLLHLLRGNEIEAGIPKGITFSPDGACLLVTLSETNSVINYTLDYSMDRIISTPRQVLSGAFSQLSRPEDIKFTADGNYFAVSNSSNDTVTFYMYDKENNSIVNYSPSYIIENPDAELSFPHGLAFSSDGKYLAVTQFGPVLFDENSNLSSWGNGRRDSVALYKLK